MRSDNRLSNLCFRSPSIESIKVLYISLKHLDVDTPIHGILIAKHSILGIAIKERVIEMNDKSWSGLSY